MYKPKGLLKVVSILLIIFGVLGALITLLIYAMLPQVISMYESMDIDASFIADAYTPLSIALSILGSLVSVLAGVFGVSGKSMQLTMIFGGIYSLLTIIDIIMSIVGTGFSLWLVVDLILPILYWWGIYQTKEA